MKSGWLVAILKSNCDRRRIGGMLSVRVFQIRKTKQNSKRLGRQARPGIEHGIPHLTVLSEEQLHHCKYR